jgi:hypothetical protein
MPDPLSRRAELVDHALQYGWFVTPGVRDFSAHRVIVGKQTQRHTIQATLNSAGTITSAKIDDRVVAGGNRLGQVAAALRRGQPSYRAGRTSNRGGAVHWVPRQHRSGVAPQALCGTRITSELDHPNEIGRWRWSKDPVDCVRCQVRWASAVASLRDWTAAADPAPSILPGVMRVYGGASTGSPV